MEHKTENVQFELKSEILKVKLSGEIDHHSAIGIKRSIDSRLYSARPSVLCLNLEKIGFMDSSGLGLILGRYQLCRELGVKFAIENPSYHVMKILKVAGCDKLIKIEKGDKDNAKENKNHQ